MDLLERFKASINKNGLFSARDNLLLAVSGGVDSVVLCELCRQTGFSFLIAHCNFQLRGAESERDEVFVKRLGSIYNTPVLVKKFDTETYALKHRLSIQEAARTLRYEWFAKLLDDEWQMMDGGQLPSAVRQPPSFLLTAHHADDNIETVLMNFFRGTGLSGLSGIPAVNDRIRRPLLPFFKEDLLQFARDHKLEWVEDSSNELSKYTRNFFRNEIIPAITNVYPQVKANLQDNIDRFREIGQLYQHAVGEIKNQLCRKKGNELHIPLRQLLAMNNRALVYEIIKDFGFAEKQVDEVIKLGDSESGRYIQSPANTYRIIRHRHWLIISPLKSTEAINIIIEPADKLIDYPGGQLRIEETSTLQPQTSNLVACLDANQISYPLLLRPWKAGDYFYPLGMKKKKKLARFFIDQKLSKTEKENIWVIEMNRKIAWVVGHRIDDRFKITDKTKQQLRMSVQT
jgi:tRNA(Ile)-lysidine synthase